MKILFSISICLLLLGCGDCIQELSGNVLDSDSEILLSGVKIWKEEQPEAVILTGENGEFEFRATSGGLFNCPDLKLHFQKKGYKVKILTFPAASHDTVEIRLEKNYESFGIRQQILDTVKLIENDNYISTGVVGHAGKKPVEYDRRRWLMANATEEELILLTDYPNAVVKATVFHGLFKMGNPQVAKFLVDFSKSKETIGFQAGCTGSPMLLSEYCFTNVMNYELPGSPPIPPPDTSIKQRVELTEIEKQLVIAGIQKNKIKAQ